MVVEASGYAPGGAVAVHLLADPGLPADMAHDLAGELPQVLSRRVSDQVQWQVNVESDRLVLDDQGEVQLAYVVAHDRAAQDGDLVIYLTDHPRRIGLRPLVADLKRDDGVALACLPALGMLRLEHRARALVVRLVEELVGERVPRRESDESYGEARHDIGGALAAIRRNTVEEDESDVRFVGTGGRGQLRLVAGMVRANRPWRLVPALSGAFAGALATGAYVLISQQLWRLADALSPMRLTIASVFAVAAMIVWLIVDHHLWERPSGRAARQLAVLYNTATALTLTVGVLSLYAGLFALSLLAGAFLLPSRVLRDALGHQVNWREWVTIAWFVTSVATVGGAIGSSLESDEAVRQAAYGYRQRERRSRQDEDERSRRDE
jgi:hypothetical protein